MRVKIGNQWHDSREEPVAIQISPGEQEQIAGMDRSVAPNGRYAVFPDSWSANPGAMRRWIAEEGKKAIPPHQELDEAHALLVWVLGITLDELEPPILKEMGDVQNARQMDRKMLEEKYALARMTARLSLHKAHHQEAQAERLRHANEFRKARLRIEASAADLADRERDDARALIEKVTGKPFCHREALAAGEEVRRREGGAA